MFKFIKLKKIRKHIVCGSDLLKDGKPVPLSRDTASSINCYAYSLGIMYSKSGTINHIPGYTEKKSYKGTSPVELMQNIQIDLNNLRIPYRRIELDETITLNQSEYLIKVFYAPPNQFLDIGDFHLIRQDNKTGLWFHKLGWFKQPSLTQLDNDFKKESLGYEPEIITCRGYDGSTYINYPVCYLAITEI